MIFHAFLIKYAEIAIKGKNRYLFEDALVKQTTAVVAVSVFLGAIITLIDSLLKYGIDWLVR